MVELTKYEKRFLEILEHFGGQLCFVGVFMSSPRVEINVYFEEDEMKNINGKLLIREVGDQIVYRPELKEYSKEHLVDQLYDVLSRKVILGLCKKGLLQEAGIGFCYGYEYRNREDNTKWTSDVVSFFTISDKGELALKEPQFEEDEKIYKAEIIK